MKFNTGCSEGLILDRTVLRSVNLTSIGMKARYDVSLSVDSMCTLIGQNGVFTQEYVDMVVGSHLICLELFLRNIS